MRDSMLKGKSFWKIKAGEQIGDDIVADLHKDDINIEDLPKKGAFFKTFSDELCEYMEIIKKELYNTTGKWEKVDNITEYSMTAYYKFDNLIIEESFDVADSTERQIRLHEYIEMYRKTFGVLLVDDKTENVRNIDFYEKFEKSILSMVTDMMKVDVISGIQNDNCLLVA